ncbi:ABC transporter, permease protein [Actinomyces urogenitalis DSM 15434]|uniref:ABC transporter, permease protein n=3 Tax=root TaxID=1 RepID=C0W654_9ACTO|nr:sugar ABC transporter permease [Actinomyces urogenitalis]EEH65748.1 ABC transporter, permease protein [Actinomyces urogenitalis DSM 15434]ETJ03911.1 MAG: Sugar ABC superfamily ATP binding cassette transporter, membrane protein [Actinomyces urogenitalis DORA_12]
MNQLLSRKRYILGFVGPAFLLFFAFALFPIAYNVWMSLFRTDLMSPSQWVGLENYKNLFEDRIFLTSLKNNLLMVVGSLLAHLPLALLLGNFLFHKVRGSQFFQSVFFLPCVVCGVAVGLTWTFIYNSQFGLVNSILDGLRAAGLKREWLSDEKTVMLAIIVVVMWQFVGYHMVIQLAAMRSIPAEMFEAATVDGASSWQQFKMITLPMIRPMIKVDAILIITGSLKYFDLVMAMTKGGPNHASEVMSTYMYTSAFRTLKFGYASAIANILLILCVVAILLSNFVFKSEKIEY